MWVMHFGKLIKARARIMKCIIVYAPYYIHELMCVDITNLFTGK